MARPSITNGRFSGAAPGGFTGAEGSTCISCHGGNPLNASGGSVVINNLPATYLPGTTYNLSVTINHGAANRNRWGFALKAVGSNGSAVGTLTENNPNVYVNATDKELGHSSAPSTSASNTFTFTNLSWTAPANPTATEQNISFYVAANASGNNNFIYTTVRNVILNTSSTSETELLEEKLNPVINGKNIFARIQLRNAANIKAIVVNMAGQQVMQLPSRRYGAGSHTLTIDANTLKSGSYILILQNEQQRSTARILIQ